MYIPYIVNINLRLNIEFAKAFKLKYKDVVRVSFLCECVWAGRAIKYLLLFLGGGIAKVEYQRFVNTVFFFRVMSH